MLGSTDAVSGSPPGKAPNLSASGRPLDSPRCGMGATQTTADDEDKQQKPSEPAATAPAKASPDGGEPHHSVNTAAANPSTSQHPAPSLSASACQSPTPATAPTPAPSTAPSTASLAGSAHKQMLPSRPRSVADISPGASTPLQRHYHHQRHQSSVDLKPSSSAQQPAASSIAIPTAPDNEKHRPKSIDMPLTGDNRPGRTPETPRAGILSSWLPGSGASPSWSATSTPAGASNTPTKLRKAPTTPQTASPASRFAFISSSFSALTKSATSSPAGNGKNNPVGSPDDELLNLNIHEALYPTAASPSSPSSPGPASPRDPFSPASYKNLEMSATALLNKFQAGYRRQAEELYVMKTERDARAEETEEAEMRVQHLKLQLENLAKQAAEREREMQALLQALDRERRVNAGGAAASGAAAAADGSEDLGAEEDQKQLRRWRKSGAFEDTDEESLGETPSVFSRSRSPTVSTMAASGTETPLSSVAEPSQLQPPKSSASSAGGLKPTAAGTAPRSAPQQIGGAFQKLVKGFTAGEGSEGASCRTCRGGGGGQDGQVAWDTVGLLKEENKGLKLRVSELESAVEMALDVVNGIPR